MHNQLNKLNIYDVQNLRLNIILLINKGVEEIRRTFGPMARKTACGSSNLRLGGSATLILLYAPLARKEIQGPCEGHQKYDIKGPNDL